MAHYGQKIQGKFWPFQREVSEMTDNSAVPRTALFWTGLTGLTGLASRVSARIREIQPWRAYEGNDEITESRTAPGSHPAAGMPPLPGVAAGHIISPANDEQVFDENELGMGLMDKMDTMDKMDGGFRALEAHADYFNSRPHSGAADDGACGGNVCGAQRSGDLRI